MKKFLTLLQHALNVSQPLSLLYSSSSVKRTRSIAISKFSLQFVRCTSHAEAAYWLVTTANPAIKAEPTKIPTEV